MAKMEGLAHVGLFISDLEKSKEFYTSVLEFKVIEECSLEEADGREIKIAFVQNGNLVIELVQFPDKKERGDGLFDHVALYVEDIETVRDTLASRGVEFETKEITYASNVFPKGSRWILFRGPDNEHLEITEKLK